MEQIIELHDFLGGINQNVDGQLIGLNEAASAQNCEIGDGNLSRSKGCSLYSSGTLANGIPMLMQWYSGASSTIIAVSNNTLYKLTGNTFTALPGTYTSMNFDYINYQTGDTEIMIFTNGVDPVKVYDGSTIRDLLNDGAGTTPGTDNQAPKGSLIELHRERVFIAGDPENVNRLYFSNDYDPDDWTAPVDPLKVNEYGGMIELPSWDGSKIIGLRTLFGDLLVFKNKNVQRLYGSYPGNYSVNNIFNSVNGEIIDKTIAAKENHAFWVTSDGIFIFDAVNTVNLKAKIKAEFDKINFSYISKAVAVIYKGKYIVAVPEGTSQFNNLIFEYDIDNNYFMVRRGFVVNSFLEFNGMLLFSSNDGKIYTYNSGDTYNTGGVIAYWKTGAMHLGNYRKKKRIKRVQFVGKGDGTIKITCENEVPGAQTTSVIALTNTETVYELKVKNKGKLLKFTFENITGENFTIKQPQIICEIPE